MATGHYILRNAHLSGYKEPSIKSSMEIGAIGGCLMTLPMMFLFEWLLMQINPLKFEEEDSETDSESGVSKKKPKRDQMLGNLAIALIIVQFVLVIFSTVALGAGAGAIGSAILKATHHDVLSVLLATRAGAVGAAVVGPGVVLVVLLVVGCCGGVIGTVSFLATKKK